MDEIKRDGGIGDAAASNDNEAARRAFDRIWPLIAASSPFIEEFGVDCKWEYTDWGSDADLKQSTDGYIFTQDRRRILVANRVQEKLVRQNTFTLRTNQRNMEFEKLVDGRDKTDYHLQAYVIKDKTVWLGGKFKIAGWIRTPDLRKFVVQYPGDRWLETNNQNGIPFWCVCWDNIFDRARPFSADAPPMRYCQAKMDVAAPKPLKQEQELDLGLGATIVGLRIHLSAPCQHCGSNLAAISADDGVMCKCRIYRGLLSNNTRAFLTDTVRKFGRRRCEQWCIAVGDL